MCKERNRANLRGALRTLDELKLAFRGPFVTRGGTHLYVVDKCILTACEILELNASARLTLNSIDKLRAGQRIEMVKATPNTAL